MRFFKKVERDAAPELHELTTPLKKSKEMPEPSALDKLTFNIRENAKGRKLPRYIILHNSKFKAVWDWFVLLLVIYTSIEIPYTAAFGQSQKSPLQQLKAGSAIGIVNLIVDLMFVVDILINFRSTYTRQGTDELVSNPRKIACNYLKSWFVIDFLAAIPFELFVEAGGKGAISLAGLLKTARLLRLVRVSRKLDRYSEYGLAVVILLTCLFTLVAHWLACIWYFIGRGEIRNKHGWITLLGEQTGQPVNTSAPENSGPSMKSRYVTSLYFTLTSLTSIGFGNVAPNTNAEKLFAVAMMLVGALMYAAIFGNMTAIIQRLYTRTARYHKDLKVIKEFIRFHNIPDTLRDTLTEYFTHEWSSRHDQQLDTVLRRFPDSLQSDVCVHIHRAVFGSHHVFHKLGEGCVRALSVKFNIKNYLPGHYIIKEGDEVKYLYFVVEGTVDVIKSGKSLSILGPGDSAGGNYDEMRGNSPLKANVSLMVRHYVEVHYVKLEDLYDVANSFPELAEVMSEHMKFTHDFGRYISAESGLVGNVPWSALVLSAPLGVSTLNVPSTPSQERMVKESKASISKDDTNSNTLYVNSKAENPVKLPGKANGSTRAKHYSAPCGTKPDFNGVLCRIDSLDERLVRVEERLEEILFLLKKSRSDSNGMFKESSYL